MSGDERADTLVDERELAAAMRGLRADPADFRAAVERRIREAKKARESNAAGPATSEPRTEATWWRRAAGWLPPELVPGSLAAGGAKLSWKALFGLLALPAITFAMLAMPVVLALQSMASQADERSKERLAAVRGWWVEHKRAAVVTLAVIGILFLRAPSGAGAALLLVSTGVLAMLLVRLRAAGFGRRSDVARHCASLIFSLVIWMTMIAGPWKNLFPSERSQQFANFALMASGVVCAATALRANHRTLWSLVTRSKTADALLMLEVTLFAPLSVMSLWAGLADLKRVDWVQSVEKLRPWGSDWDQARRIVAHLQRTGDRPDLSGLRAHWLERRGDHEQLPGFLVTGIDLGFVEEPELKVLGARARELLDEDHPVTIGSLRSAALLALVRSNTLALAEREHLARRLVASLDGDDDRWPFGRLVIVAALLDELGQGEQANALRPNAHALLRRYWIPGNGLPFSEAEFGYSGDTLDAIDLMRRFGVPAEIDLPSLRRTLRGDLQRPLPWQRASTYQWRSQLALSELEYELLPPRGWFASLGENTVLLALVVLCTFCVVATLRTPHERLV